MLARRGVEMGLENTTSGVFTVSAWSSRRGEQISRDGRYGLRRVWTRVSLMVSSSPDHDYETTSDWCDCQAFHNVFCLVQRTPEAEPREQCRAERRWVRDSPVDFWHFWRQRRNWAGSVL